MEEIFQKVIEYGRIVRANGLDGLKSWNNIKGLFTNQLNCGKWKIVRTIKGTDTSDINEIFNYVHDELGMYGDETDDNSNHDLWSKRHFYLQLIRIILKNKDFSFVRLAQIAYNIGQLSNHLETDEMFSGEPLTYYHENKLGDISSYVELSDCDVDSDEMKKLSEELDNKIRELQEQTGGKGKSDYYQKYLKYKNKYLELKKHI